VCVCVCVCAIHVTDYTFYCDCRSFLVYTCESMGGGGGVCGGGGFFVVLFQMMNMRVSDDSVDMHQI